MTGRRILVRRYALALAELASERGLLDEVERGLSRVARRLQEDAALRRLWLEGHVEAERKLTAIREALGDDVPEMVYGFLRVVAQKGREGLLSAMAEQVQVEADRLRDVVRVEVETAVPLTPDQEQMLSQRLRDFLGASGVRLSVRVNPDLIGGLVVRAGDLRLDGSLSRQLWRLRDRLRTAPMPPMAVSADGKAG
ncbi:ATP synthase F1 subunit delta [Geochorda subterranea]|uniref:ATP synthase subunit delta n=1 Tax=Geochorda subterranea TaxID=3109564 RepID=A0ABZ1BPV5_9FIRM|nr:ATP synthase F1 subunit delta [Limnochorda sp. LNt]WRP14832.1 ATP synthase F1 subunit delta [Limnochorda sp. LNt]